MYPLIHLQKSGSYYRILKQLLFLGLLFGVTLISSLLWLDMSTRAAHTPVAVAREQSSSKGIRQSLTSPDQIPTGISAVEWKKVQQKIETARYTILPDTKQTGQWIAEQSKHKWQTRFDTRGFTVKPANAQASWEWGLQLNSYGFPGQERRIAQTPTVKAEGTRLTYQWQGGVEEWYNNDPKGLEHGFTVQKRPAGAVAGNPLTFTLGVRGNLRARTEQKGQNLAFVNQEGKAALMYSELKVWDATGKTLAARLEAKGNEVLLKVEEEGAQYPITVDPTAIPGPAYFKPSPAADNLDYFGFGVAISGDTMVVSAPGDDGAGNAGPIDRGAVYVFRNVGGVWALEATLRAGNPDSFDGFGGPTFFALSGTNGFLNNGSIAIDGDTLVIGAPFEDGCDVGPQTAPTAADTNLCLNSGAVYVFVRSGTTWTQQAYLKASNRSNTLSGDAFGWDVDISGNTIVVGAPLEDATTRAIIPGSPNEAGVGGNDAIGGEITDHGAAYVFTRTGTTWTQESYLKPPNVTLVDIFGASVAIDGDKIIVGAFGDDGGSTGAQAAPPTSQYDIYTQPFGTASINSGAAHVYSRAAGTWSYASYLKAFNIGTQNVNDYFGFSVDISGNTAIVGGIGEDSDTTTVNSPANDTNLLTVDSGAAYTYTMGAPWTNGAYLKANHHTNFDYFGKEVAINGTDVVVGAPGEDGTGNGINPALTFVVGLIQQTGAVYKYNGVAGTAATFESYIKQTCPDVVGGSGNPMAPAPASMFGNVDNNSYFGNAVAINMGTVGVGAPYEGGTGTGINPLYNATLFDVGAAYIPGNCNTPPTIAGTPVSAPVGGPAATVPVATAGDMEDPSNVLTIAISSDGVTFGSTATLNGVTATLIDQNAGAAGINPGATGIVNASVVAACNATNATFTVRVTDSGGLRTTSTFPVTVTANTPPVLTYGNVSVAKGAAITNTPTTATDNAGITGYSIVSPGTYTGGISVSPAGVVSFSNAGPSGVHTITVRATDNCGLNTDATFTITVLMIGASITDPIVCSGDNMTLGVRAEVMNPTNTAQGFTFTAPIAAPLAGIPGTCVVSGGTCTITSTQVTVTGTLAPLQNITIDYKVRVAPGTAIGTQFCITSTVVLANNATASVRACNTLNCPTGANPRVSDQKPGSVLVFPYYTSSAAQQRDTRLTISNVNARNTNVHVFLIAGANCAQADFFVCLTAFASLTFRSSEYDPEMTGYLMAVAVNEMGQPIANNSLIGNAFVNDGVYQDNYGAESFAANSPSVAALNPNGTATLFFDGSSYDAVPSQFAVEVQSAASAPGQRIVTVGLNGDLTAGSMSGASQVGTGLVINGNESPTASFVGWLSGSCQASATISSVSPRVPGSMLSVIPSGQVGTLRFNVGGAVGLLMTPNTAMWRGIRTLHKTGVTSTRITIPVFMPVC